MDGTGAVIGMLGMTWESDVAWHTEAEGTHIEQRDRQVLLRPELLWLEGRLRRGGSQTTSGRG